MKIKIYELEEVDSTNDYVERLVKEKKINDDIILVANSQTKGHGTKGRFFLSDKDVGLYFTIALFYNDEIKYLTQKVSVAIKKAIYELYNVSLDIKWINDLYYRDKKVCGILCKNIINRKCIIIGIGIDLYKNENLSDDLKKIVGYIFEEKIVDKKELVKKIYENIHKSLYEELDEVYRKENIALNKKVKVLGKIGEVIDIDCELNLIIKFDYGIEKINDTNIVFLGWG